MINPIERLNKEIALEKDEALGAINGPEVTRIRLSLANSYKEGNKTALDQGEFASLIGVSHERTVSWWEQGRRKVGMPHLLTLHRLSQVLRALPQGMQGDDRYRFLVTPQDDLLKENPVSPIELLRMPSIVGLRIVMASLQPTER